MTEAVLYQQTGRADWLHRLWAHIQEIERVELCSRLTLMLLVLYPPTGGFTRPALLALALVAALSSRLRGNAVFWLVVTLVVVQSNLSNWTTADNHKHLLGYWCLALACCRISPDPNRALAEGARWLLVAVFGWAVLWKVISPDFLDGSFFHATLLTDDRFKAIATALGDYGPTMIEQNDTARDALIAFGGDLQSVTLATNSRIAHLASFFTISAIVLELAIACLFSMPRARIGAVRAGADAALVLFLVTTYAVAPVAGFGSTLAILGLAQAGSRPLALAGFAGALALVQIYRIPAVVAS